MPGSRSMHCTRGCGCSWHWPARRASQVRPCCPGSRPGSSGYVRGPRHAANQVLAQQVLNILLARGHIIVDPADTDVLTQPFMAATTTLDYAQRRARPDPLQRETDEEFDRYPFFLDFEQYWCDDVAEAFGSTDEHVARRAVEIAGELNGTDLVAARDDLRVSAPAFTALNVRTPATARGPSRRIMPSTWPFTPC